MNKKAIAHNKQCIDTCSRHYLTNETNAHDLRKKLALVFKQKTVWNEIFLLKKLVYVRRFYTRKFTASIRIVQVI